MQINYPITGKILKANETRQLVTQKNCCMNGVWALRRMLTLASLAPNQANLGRLLTTALSVGQFVKMESVI